MRIKWRFNDIGAKKMLKQLPEQKPFWSRPSERSYPISKEFERVIDMAPEYYGMILHNKKTAEVPYLTEKGYEPELTLRNFFLGLVYAFSKRKPISISIPKGAGSEIEEKIEKAFKEVYSVIKIHEYPLFTRKDDRFIKLKPENKIIINLK